MYGSGRSLVGAFALAGLLVLALATTSLSGCGGGSTGDSATTELPSLADFELVKPPVDSDVRFTYDDVLWLTRSVDLDESSLFPDVDEVSTYDVATGQTTTDEWLSGLFVGSPVVRWETAGDRVAWLGVSERIGAADGTTYERMSVSTAVRGEDAPTVLAPLAWAVSRDSGGSAAVTYVDCSPSLVVWEGSRNELSEDLSRLREIDIGRVEVWDSEDGSRVPLATRGGGQLLALGERQAFTASGLGAASDFGGRIIRAWDADTEARSTIRPQGIASLPAAADDATLVWTVVSDEATDLVDADLAACDLESGEVFTISDAPGGQTKPTVDGDVVVWVDTPLTYFSPLPDGSFPLRTLHGMQLSSRTESTLVAGPPHSESEDSDFDQVQLIGDHLFWTVLDAGECTVYGARMVADGAELKLEPLRD